MLQKRRKDRSPVCLPGWLLCRMHASYNIIRNDCRPFLRIKILQRQRSGGSGQCSDTELFTVWVDPRVGLGSVGLGWVESTVAKVLYFTRITLLLSVIRFKCMLFTSICHCYLVFQLQDCNKTT